MLGETSYQYKNLLNPNSIIISNSEKSLPDEEITIHYVFIIKKKEKNN